MSLFDRLVVTSLPFVPKAVVRRIASRYVAGETFADAVAAVKALAAEGAMSTLDVLGESVTRAEETYETRDQYLEALDGIARERLPANVSVKPTAVGLAIDPALAFENCRARSAKSARKCRGAVTPRSRSEARRDRPQARRQ